MAIGIVAVFAVVAVTSSHPLRQLSLENLEYVSQEDRACAYGDTLCHELSGCCPTENAVCCSNMKHCCPEGYTCDVEKERCTRKGTSLHLNSSVSETELIPHVVKCGDKEGSVCPDNTVCCIFTNHIGHGCCEGERSHCCDDYRHCCPEGTTCDVANGYCVKNVLKMYAPRNPRSVVCPDGSTQCANGNTCCPLLVNGTYGCCPKPEAVCCSDKTSCCPHGYSCGRDQCSHDDFSILALAKMPLLPPVNRKTVCKDGNTVCGMNDTCCMHEDKSWGCCPSPNAVCCSDGHHCCPEKYTCDMKDFTCMPESNEVQGLKITPASDTSFIKIHIAATVCPGGKYVCTKSQTCCKFNAGWGCCHGNGAVCCSDNEYCCPKGFKCENNGKCTSVNYKDKDAL